MSVEYSLLYITIIPQAHTKNERVINKHKWNNSFIKSAPKYIQIFPKFFIRTTECFNVQKHFWFKSLQYTLWYNGS